MFYIIGLGLGNAKDVTVKGLEIIKRSKSVYLESYTSILPVGKEELEELYGRSIIVADREIVEGSTDEILENARNDDIAILIVGDPFTATTHIDLALRAKEKNIEVEIVHNASIMNAVGCCGLQLYSFGETISIPSWTEKWQPDSYYERIIYNYNRGLHTLCLLDIRVKEPTIESLVLKKKVYMPPKFMSVAEAASQLLKIIEQKNKIKKGSAVISAENYVVGLARVGSDSQKITVCTLTEMEKTDLGPPLHTLIIPGLPLHPLEIEYVKQFATDITMFQERMEGRRIPRNK
ncbi:diphthine methyl ester synthase [Phymastichus coffea]|uniref:diphthine methyl ester synthase n=1 Tax=Phymastichus coffea TaxID=108790 RepID=UPI00273CB743|nr:diphthine methyl ester synthase [Phymastichus coffea]